MKNIGELYSSEYMNIPKMFFTPYHELLRQQGNEGNNVKMISKVTIASKVTVT